MSKRITLNILTILPAVLGYAFVLSGCSNDDMLIPKITDSHPQNTFNTLPPIITPSPKPSKNIDRNIPGSWLPPSQLERKWTAIVIHHSGTKQGNAAIFDKWHKEGRHWEGVGYDFVIGNGTNSADGKVEVTFRWREQRTGAHCKTPNNWANKYAIGICLVGNFDQTSPTRRQIQSLVKLIRFLQNRYGIPKSRIYGHNTTPGANKTDCPGKKFPMAWLKSMLH